jgi:hypothetical protein
MKGKGRTVAYHELVVFGDAVESCCESRFWPVEIWSQSKEVKSV